MKKKILIIIIAILLVGGVCGTYFMVKRFNKKNDETQTTEPPQEEKLEPIVKPELVVETGSSIPDISWYFESIDSTEGFQINYLNENETVENREELVLYSETTNCAEEVEGNPTNCIGTDLVVLRGVYSYVVTITNGEKTYTSHLVVQDTTSPTLIVKDVEITFGNKVSINDFLESCTDNSHTDCRELKLVDDNGEIVESLPTQVGEHKLKFVIEVEEGNKSEIKEATLNIKKKTANSSSGNNSGSSSGSSNNNSSSNSGSNQGTSSGNSSNSDTNPTKTCGSEGYKDAYGGRLAGYATIDENNKRTGHSFTITKEYILGYNCNGTTMENLTLHQYQNAYLGACNEIYYDPNTDRQKGKCGTNYEIRKIYDVATGVQVGWLLKITMEARSDFSDECENDSCVITTGYLGDGGYIPLWQRPGSKNWWSKKLGPNTEITEDDFWDGTL